RAGVGNDLEVLNAVEKRNRLVPRFGDTGRVPGQLVILQQSGRADGEVLTSAAACLGNPRRDGQPAPSESPAQLDRLMHVRKAQRSSSAGNGGTSVSQNP